jgi:membrane associated rhomboid family serine protease
VADPGAAPDRRPVLTAAVAAGTVTVSVAGLVSPGLQDDLARVPGEWAAGEWWRLATSLLVHDGWVALVGNLVLLVVIGAAAEARLPRPAWAGLYVAGGLVGELVGLRWQPHGAGNSVAVFGLAGGLAVLGAVTPDDAGLALPLGLGVAWVAALLAADIGGAAPTVGAALLAAGGSLTIRRARRGPLPRATIRAAAAVLTVGALALTAMADIHGPAILAGLAATAGGLAVTSSGRSAGRGAARSGVEAGDLWA